MTYFTDSPYERMMTKRPERQRGNAPPPLSHPPRCQGCPYRRAAPCIGVCIKELNQKGKENTNL